VSPLKYGIVIAAYSFVDVLTKPDVVLFILWIEYFSQCRGFSKLKLYNVNSASYTMI